MQAYSLKLSSSGTAKIILFDFGRATPANDRFSIKTDKISKSLLNFKVSENDYIEAYRKQLRKRNFEIPRWPSDLPANLRRPVSPPGQTGRHKLAGNSKGHRGNIIFFVNFVFNDPF